MRKLYILLAFILGVSAAAIAQPTVTVGNGLNPNNGDNFCVPFSVRDFTNINSLQFTIEYDPAILDFTTAANFHPTMVANGNLGVALFSEPTPGLISFETWESGDCSDMANVGVTLADDEVIFDVCFDAIGTYGQQSEICIGSSPTPIICTRNATLCQNIGLFIECSTATIDVRPLVIAASDENGNEGDFICMDLVIESGFDALASIQYSIGWDETILTCTSFIPGEDVPNLSVGNAACGGNVPPGRITFSWAAIPGQPLPSVPDGTLFGQVCFDIIGDCENQTTINFVSDPTPIEITNEDPDNPNPQLEIPFQGIPSSVIISDCDPTGIQLIIDCGQPVDINEQFCVQVEAGNNFDNVSDLRYLMEWNAAILQFSSVTDPNNLAGLGPEDFNTDNTGNGILGLDWSNTAGPDISLGAGTVIYEVCFDVVGLGGNSPIQIITPGVGVSNDVNIGINPSNCVVEVNQPDGVGMVFGDLDLPLGEQGCFPVTVTNFNEILSYQFSMSWDENLWSFVQATNFNPGFTNASAANITPFGSSSLFFDWEDPSAVTLADGSVLFELCFTTADGATPGNCDEMMTIPLPLVEEAISTSSNGENIGIISTPNEACILFPEGFGLTAVSTAGGWLDTVCMDFTVESFDNITAAEFMINWNPNELNMVSNEALAWTGLTLTPNPVGVLNGSFSSATPLAIPDGEVAFQVCFELIGDPNECYAVNITDDPLPTVETALGPGSMVITNGEICIEDQIVIDEITITPASCPDACDGAISITVFQWDGQGFIGTTWSTGDFSPLMVDDVCPGEVSFTIFDNNSGVTLTDTVTVPFSGTVPTITIAGDDTISLDCSSGLSLLCADAPDDNITYNWYLNTTFSPPVGTDNPCFFADQAGNFILEGTNAEGCSSTDTVTVVPPIFPEADAGGDPSPGITCSSDTLFLNGNGVGENLLFQWAVCEGFPGALVESTANDQIAQVTAPGRYCLTVTNAVTGCSDTDEVIVADDRIFPIVCIPEDTQVQPQNCDGTPNDFEASCSENPGLDVSFQWFMPDGTPANTGLSASFTEIGTYNLVAIESISGCSDTTFAIIEQNAGAYNVVIEPTDEFICTTESIDLAATITPMDDNAQISWTAIEGSLEPGNETLPTAQANASGIYQITVLNPENNCEAVAIDTVVNNTTPPVASLVAESVETINCYNNGITIDGSTSDAGDMISYQWYLGDLDTPIAGENTDSLPVNAEGTYLLEVTNNENLCTAVVDTMVMADQDAPMVVVTPLEDNLTCDDPQLLLTAEVEDGITYELDWAFLDGANVIDASIDSLELTADGAGTYQINIINLDNGCTSQAETVLADQQDEPIIDVQSDTLTLSCASTFVTLSGAGSATGDDFSYLWEAIENGETPPTPNVIQTDVMTAGVYRLTVEDISTGCTSDTLVSVGEDVIAPSLSAEPVDDLTCADLTREVTVQVEDAANFTVLWTGDPGPFPNDQPTTTISSVGELMAIVTNSDNGCQDTLTLMIDGDITPPDIVLAELTQFDCVDETVGIDASGSGDASLFDISWSSSAGTVSPAAGSLTVDVDNVGEYTLSLTSLDNGCTADSIILVEAVAEPTTPDITLNNALEQLGCDDQPVTIDISSTGDEADFSDIEWAGPGNIMPSANELIVDVDEAGDFMVTLTLAGALACEVSETFAVELDPDVPVADPGADQTVECGDLINLDGTASSTGPQYTYEWLVIEGELTGDVSGLTPSTTGGGMYQLIVNNSDNGCIDTSAVLAVTLQLPELANAGEDMDVCDDLAFLSGNAVAGTQGVWTTTSGASISIDSDPGSEIGNLSLGQNAFTWTLSAPGCEEYSSDEVVISRAELPIGNDDLLELLEGARNGQINFLDNDQLNGVSNFDITLVSPPSFGEIDTMQFEQGILDFAVGLGVSGVTELTYQICSRDCPDLCATARVVINVTLSDEEPQVPNTITPNGDGMNDELVFDIILINPADEFPDNELIVFNRWGDIVYQAKPYNNDWQGTNDNGDPLPDATYYYVLRLDISEGVIYRGDITIIK